MLNAIMIKSESKIAIVTIWRFSEVKQKKTPEKNQNQYTHIDRSYEMRRN